MNLPLHIVAFDVPYPPDYGGAIDVFYKVKSLAEEGVSIFLHCPVYNDRIPQPELKKYCEEVFYYPRRTGLAGLSLKYPYMVASRRNDRLLENLQKIEAPILFEGASTAFYLNHESLKGRFKLFRAQNVEQHYFQQLAEREKSLFKKTYYSVEARLLKSYEKNLQAADLFLTVSRYDHAFFKDLYPGVLHEYLPSFQPYEQVESASGSGKFCIYHGNLEIAENKEAVSFLVEQVAPHIVLPLIIAGRNPDEVTTRLIEGSKNVQLFANPDQKEMTELIADAQLHVLPTFQNTGLKLKLLHALFKGRFVVVTEQMVHGTGLSDACIIAKDAGQFADQINFWSEKTFSEDDRQKRQRLLSQHYNNRLNAQKIISYLR